MTTDAWFDDLSVLGAYSREAAVAKLHELGEEEAALAIETEPTAKTYGGPDWWPFGDKAWQHTAHAFGYLAPAGAGTDLLPIQHAGNVTSDPGLKDGRIKVTLDQLRVANYPGGSTHHILFDFYARNQVKDGAAEHLHFNATYRAREGERVAAIGYPLFVGLNVGGEGVAFKCFTVNVKNDADESFLRFLDSDVFKAGLRLAETVQPAVALFSGMAQGLTRGIATRNRNVPVQDFYMGLDFSNITTRARLREGSYLAVQIPETFSTVWSWDDWVYNPANGHVVNKADNGKLIPYNYVVFGVSRHD